MQIQPTNTKIQHISCLENLYLGCTEIDTKNTLKTLKFKHEPEARRLNF